MHIERTPARVGTLEQRPIRGRQPIPVAAGQQAWAYVRDLWEGDPGGRGWQVRVLAGATWLALPEDEDPARGEGPEPTFGFGDAPVDEGVWQEPGY